MGLDAEGADRDDALRQERATYVDDPAIGPARCARRAAAHRRASGAGGAEKGAGAALLVGSENRKGGVNSYSSTTITRMAHTHTNTESVYGI